METDSVVAETPSSSGLTLTLHPLVIMNISEHFTRRKVQLANQPVEIYGAILGIQSGREIEIFNSFEFPADVVNGDVVVNHTFFISKSEQFKQVFPTYDFLGWYSTGQIPTQTSINIHKQMMAYNESPLFLQLSPTSISKELPITIYESVVDPSGKMMFYTSTYKIETGEAERIAVDHVAKVSDGGKESQVTTQMNSQKNAIQMLHMRIKLLHKYLSDVKDGKIPKDYNILRAILALGNRFPSLDSAEFNDELLVEYTDVLLMQHLATVSKGIFAMSELIEKFNVVAEKQRRMGHGMERSGSERMQRFQ